MMQTIRRMQARDLDAVEALERESFTLPWTRAALESDALENRCARYLVLERDGQLLAYAGLWLVMEEAYITRIATRPDCRGAGLAAQLLGALLQLASNLGVRYVTLEVRLSNTAAQRLYEKCGFERVGVRKRYYEDNGEDALLLLCQRMPPPNDDFADDEAFVED